LPDFEATHTAAVQVYGKDTVTGEHLYQTIAHRLRAEILSGKIASGSRLPSIRALADEWGCTPATVQKAYQELAGQGLVISRSGQGTRVIGGREAGENLPLRKAALIHKAETYALEVLTDGYTPAAIELALRIALARWRVLQKTYPDKAEHELRFVGSHDLAVLLLAGRVPELSPGFILQVAFSGSLGGLIALADREADLAGIHLWDEESDTYNLPFVRRILPGKKVVLVTLAHRRLGLILPAGNPKEIHTVEDLARQNLCFINRQSGAGTRVWLDAQLQRYSIQAEHIQGYKQEAATHSEVAMAVLEGRADAGIGIESAAISHGLAFEFLTRERYDLVLPEETWRQEPVQQLMVWLDTQEAKQSILLLGGYDTSETGTVQTLL